MNTKFNDNEKQIIEEINKHVASFKCPVCAHEEFMLGGGYFAHDLQQDLKSRQIGGINIPTIPIVCKNCGYIAEFAAAMLGLLQEREKKEEEKKDSEKENKDIENKNVSESQK